MFDIVRVAKAEVYHNTSRLTLKQIKALKGCTHIINAWVFNGQFKPLSWLVIDGKVIAKDQYNDWGFYCDGGKTEMSTDRTKSFISGWPMLKDGKKLERGITDDMARRAERTAVGWTADGKLILYCDKTKLVPEELKDKMLELGAVDALMMDGGGSTQGIFPGGTVSSSRIVPTVILVWEEEDMSKKVCLDAGHDASNTANASPDKTYYEHEFTLDMAKRMGAILKNHGVEVTYTRTGGEEVTLARRCSIANAVKGLDLFVSLHTNAGSASGWSDARGWEAYVYGLTGERYKAAKAILSRVEEVAKLRSTPIRANPELYVLKNTSAPAVLIEHAFHTNKEDVALLKSAAYREKLAQAQAYGILDYLGVAVKETAKSEADLAVEWITGLGVMAGSTNGDLMLEQPLTRKQFAVMLYRFAKKKNLL